MIARRQAIRVDVAAAPRVVVDPLEPRRLFAAVSLVAPLPALSTTFTNTEPSTLVRDAAGNLYGVDPQGAAADYGTVYEVTPSTGVVSVLYSFDGSTGVFPTALAIDAAGNLFGITEESTATGSGSTAVGSGPGELFELPAANRATPTVLYTFGTATVGQEPTALLTDPAGDVDVLTSGGGTNGGGTIVQFAAATGYMTPSVLGSLPTDSHVYADSLVLAANGTLYGTTASGGNSGQGGDGDGTLFSLPAGSSTVGTIAQFNEATTGTLPQGQLYVDASDDVFGVCQQGSGNANFAGDVWEYTASTTTLASVAGFNDTSYPGGTGPAGGVVGNGSGDLIGTTTQGGAGGTGAGTVFSANPTTGAITELGALTAATTGSTPESGLTPDGSGNYYGVTSAGGANGRGAVFVANPSASGTTPTTTPTPTPTPTGTVPPPAVVKSSVTPSLVAGAKLKGSVTVTVDNTTGATLKGPGTFALVATDAGGAATVIGSVNRGLNLKAGRAMPVTIAARPLALPAGTYTVVPEFTFGGATAAAGTATTVVVAPAFVSLTATAAGVAPATVAAGKTLTLTLVLTNAGNVNSVGRATVTVALADPATGVTAATLPAVTVGTTVKLGGRPVTVHVRFKVPVGTTAGTYQPFVSFAQGAAAAPTVGGTVVTIS